MKPTWIVTLVALVVSATAACAPLHSHDRDSMHTGDQGAQEDKKNPPAEDD